MKEDKDIGATATLTEVKLLVYRAWARLNWTTSDFEGLAQGRCETAWQYSKVSISFIVSSRYWQ